MRRRRGIAATSNCRPTASARAGTDSDANTCPDATSPGARAVANTTTCSNDAGGLVRRDDEYWPHSNRDRPR